MASEANVDFVDDWTGEADVDALTAKEEQELVDAALASIAKHGTIAHDEARCRIDALLTGLRTG